jgi:GLPGLI family protein
MKIILFLFLTLLASTFSFAQSVDKALARVKYTLSHIRDSLTRDDVYKEEMLLLVGKNASLFTSYEKIDMINKFSDYINQQAISNGGNITNLNLKGNIPRPVTNTDFYTFVKERKVCVVELMMMNKYIYDDSISIINWKLTKDTANFSGIACKKAQAYFKGRNWIAWYAPDLPFQSGPWKLNGLPGLIITAYDERKDIQFEFSGMEKVDATNIQTGKKKIRLGTNGIDAGTEIYLGAEIVLPNDAIKATKEQVIRLRQTLTTNPQAVVNSQMTGTTVRRVSGSSIPSTTKKKVYNNPIELPEVK